MSDEKPSISALQMRIAARDRIDDFEITCKRMQRNTAVIERICQQARAAPALLQIAAAALAFVATQGDRTEPEWGDLTLALSRVIA